MQRRLGDETQPGSITIIKNYDDPLPEVGCYASLLNQVFMNLIINAIDAIDRRRKELGEGLRGKIFIKTKLVSKDAILITVEDNGTGMDYKTKAMVFDQLFTTKPVGKGTGMGLTTSYQIVVENHGGDLSCDSIPGKGTVFNINLLVKMNSMLPKSG